MNFFEAEMARCARRIRNIEANPDPTKLKANKLYYELELDLRRDQLKALQEGKPFAQGAGAEALLKAMGVQYLQLLTEGDRTTHVPKHFDTVRVLGLPDDACDRTVLPIALSVSGELPKPALLISSNTACDPVIYAINALSRCHNVPCFFIDIGTEATEDTLRYVNDQLRELIDFVERSIPGVKYDEDRLVEVQEADRQAYKYLNDIYQVMKVTPCVLSGRDVFRIPRFPSSYPNPAKAVEYFRTYRDEVEEMAQKKTPKEEQLRILWAVTAPINADLFGFLEKKGVSVPFFQYGFAGRYYGAKYGVYGDVTEYGRRLTPIEEEARMLNCNSFHGLASRWVGDTVEICRDLRIDGIVNFTQVGCTAILGIERLLSDAAERELGIPTLQLEGRMLDAREYDQTRFEDALEDFVDMCLSKKEEGRTAAG